jgi:hypothetical protein
MIIVGVVLQAGGTALSAYGSYQSGQAQKGMANYNAKLAENEAAAKEQQAHFETLQMSKERDRALASQRAALGSSGAMVSEGTPLLLMAEQAGNFELDILMQQRNRALEASALRSQATLDRFAGKQASYAGTMGAFTTVLGGAGSIGMGAASYGAAGGFKSAGGGGMPAGTKTVSASKGYSMVG